MKGNVELIGELKRITDAAYILGKAGVGLRQLASGLPGPLEPVQGKPIEKQPMGWDPDLNDGVRLNIRPFMTVPDVGRRGAGVLRDKPNINWNKDRGKDVESAPWFSVFGGDRINDHHLSLEEKRTARAEETRGWGEWVNGSLEEKHVAKKGFRG